MGAVASWWKRVDDKTKRARITLGIVTTIGNPVAGPVVQQAHLEPISPPAENQRDVDFDQEKQYANWRKLEIERESEQAGTRPLSRDPSTGGCERDLDQFEAPTRDRFNDAQKQGNEPRREDTPQTGGDPSHSRGRQRASGHGSNAKHSSQTQSQPVPKEDRLRDRGSGR